MEKDRKYVIGICALEAKARSKPMRNILQRLLDSHEFETIMFGDKVIIDEPVGAWPSCDLLISFFSTGFPLQKAIEYVNLRGPYCVNDLVMQKLLWDRRLVLLLLDTIGVRTPRRLIVSRDGGPVLSQDVRLKLHSLGVSLPLASVDPVDGSGVVDAGLCANVTELDIDTIQVGDRTLTKPFVEKPVNGENHNIWIYYHSRDGGGVRKLFRKVANKASEYDPNVHSVRTEGSYIYEVFMDVDNAEDVKVYTVGSDYIHAETRKSPVVDGIVRRNVDGKEIRFVTPLTPDELEMARRISKNFMQTVCGLDLLRVSGESYVIDVNGWSFVKGNQNYYDLCALNLRKYFLADVKASLSRPSSTVHSQIPEAPLENQWRLKSYISVFRHADRTPKQKLKFYATCKPFIALLNGQVDEITLKKKDLDLVRKAAVEALDFDLEDRAKMKHLAILLDRKSTELGTKVQIKPYFSKVDGMLEKLQIVVKWGGEFTHAGVFHSKDLGENLRKDLMIVNKEVFDDVKVYTSSERRVLATADVFLKSFLHIDDLPDGLIEVRKDMLDDSFDAKEQMEVVKRRLQDFLNPTGLHDTQAEYQLPPMKGDPASYAGEVIQLLKSRKEIMTRKFQELDVNSIQADWCCGESPDTFKERWDRLFGEFCDVERAKFDPSKVPELYDSLKYDALHNREFIDCMFVDEHDSDPRAKLRELYQKAKQLFDFVAPREYGVTRDEKLEIGILVSQILVKQIYTELQHARESSQHSVRLFFTKESHVHTLYNFIRATLAPDASDVTELDYLTQLSFELYERNHATPTEDSDNEEEELAMEYSLRIAFSQGAHDPGLIDTQMDHRHALSVSPRKWITEHIELSEALSTIVPFLEQKRAETPKPTPKLPKN